MPAIFLRSPGPLPRLQLKRAGRLPATPWCRGTASYSAAAAPESRMAQRRTFALEILLRDSCFLQPLDLIESSGRNFTFGTPRVPGLLYPPALRATGGSRARLGNRAPRMRVR